MEQPLKKRHWLKKMILDPLPVCEYFVQDGDEDIMHLILGEEGIRYSLDVHTVNREYANHIASRMKVPYTAAHPEIDPLETAAILASPISKPVLDYLGNRKFDADLCKQYQVTSWRYWLHPYATWEKYFPFNIAALLKATLALELAGYTLHLYKQEFVVIPSYDRHGVLNNLAFRFIDDSVATYMAKWIFSHGRQATFGLEKVDPNKPVYLVEGFFDYVACEKLGLQAVGLGSAFISPYHWKFLEGLDVRFLLDSDDTGRRYSEKLRQEGHKVCFLNDMYKDPWEYYMHNRELVIEDSI